MFANQVAAGTGYTQVSWFTFDTVAGGADRQRWYTMSGAIGGGASAAALTIYRNTGGNFNAGPGDERRGRRHGNAALRQLHERATSTTRSPTARAGAARSR